MEYACMLGVALSSTNRADSLCRLFDWFRAMGVSEEDPSVQVCSLSIQDEHSVWETCFADAAKLPAGEEKTQKITEFEALLDACHSETTPRAPTKRSPVRVEPYKHQALRAQYLLLCTTMN